jgi:mRNA-degrading endonuclease RelE of RelBE toxin-antitoxin system
MGQEKYRLRQEKYRIIYSVQDYGLTVWIVRVGHRTFPQSHVNFVAFQDLTPLLL